MSVKVKVNLSGKANYSVWILVLSVLALAWKRLDSLMHINFILVLSRHCILAYAFLKS
jgi:hypothetical protein